MRCKILQILNHKNLRRYSQPQLYIRDSFIQQQEPGDTISLTPYGMPTALVGDIYHRLPGKSDIYNCLKYDGSKTDHYAVVLKESDPLFNIDLIYGLTGERRDALYNLTVYYQLRDIFKKEKF